MEPQFVELPLLEKVRLRKPILFFGTLDLQEINKVFAKVEYRAYLESDRQAGPAIVSERKAKG